MSDKAALLRSYLEERGARLSSRSGWQKISCINKVAHPRGDRNPSASVNLTKGYYKCFGCDMAGDVYDLLMSEEGLTFKQAVTTLGGVAPRVEEETWL
jgi:hypothetical protein